MECRGNLFSTELKFWRSVLVRQVSPSCALDNARPVRWEGKPLADFGGMDKFWTLVWKGATIIVMRWDCRYAVASSPLWKQYNYACSQNLEFYGAR